MSDFASKISFQRPVSAKRKNKNQLYSPIVSCTRLRRVQAFLKCKGNPLNGILCIHGIDSRYNGGTKQLLNYLLFDFCELTPADVSGSKITEEELEDVVVVVKAESVHVYCNPINYPLLLPYIAHWRNLHIHCLNKDEYENNEEKAEEFKITSFISMVNDCDCLGIPYGVPRPGDQQPAFDPFVIEKWPLIQAFALEGFGGGGFFTMKHKVIDVTHDLDRIYGLFDPVVVETLISETLPLFERHCKSVLTNVDTESSSDDLLKVTEGRLSEPIMSYFTHGHVLDGDSTKSSLGDCQPFVLLGTHSSRQNIKHLAKQSSSSNNNTTIAKSGIDGNPARHMVCYAVEPKGTIKCARTYFLENGFVPVSLAETGKKSSIEHCKDLRLLMDLYLLSIHAFVDGVKTFSQTFNKQKSYSTVLSVLKHGLEERNLELQSSFLSSSVEFTIDACDSHGRSVNLQDDIPVSGLKRACLYLYDVPSVEHPGQTLGSVVFGESFLDSSIKALVPESSSIWNSSFVFLTENIPKFVSWQGCGSERQITEELESFAKSKADGDVLGKQLVFGSQVFISSPLFNRWEEGSLYIYEQGFLFVHPRVGAILLPASKLSKVQFNDKGSSSVVAFLILTYHSSIKSNLPCYLTSEHNTLVLALTSRSKIYRQFYSDVLHLWKENQLPSFPQFDIIEDLPDDFAEQHLYLQHQLSATDIQDLSTAEAFLSNLKSFLCHCCVSSSLGDKPVLCDDLPVLLGSRPEGEHKQSQDFELLLTILTGVPGSGKDSLCSALVALAKENSNWLISRRPVGDSDPFDPKVLQEFLTNMLLSQRRLHARLSASGKRSRVIVVTQGFTDVTDVIKAIRTHPHAEVAKCLKIGAVTCCVDPLNTFMENRLTLPKLLEQCAQGWVNNVVFTSCLEPKNEQLSLVQKLVRACNPDVAFVLAKGGEVTRTPDVELILSDTAFDEDKMAHKRELMCPGWSLELFSSGDADPLINEISVPFYGPLNKSRLVANLKALHGPISYRGIRTSGAIHSLQGHVCFSEEAPNKKVHVQWSRLNGVLRMNPVDSSVVPRPPSSKSQQNGTMDGIHEYFIVFTGFHLQQQVLKDWIKTCCKPAPVKQKLKVRKDLSEQEITDISSKHRFDPLPPGWFYNGTHYVSLTGDKDYNHPLLETFVEDYLIAFNEDIKRQNSLTDSHPTIDIFIRPTGSS